MVVEERNERVSMLLEYMVISDHPKLSLFVYGQPTAGGFGASTVQNPFASSSTFGQSSSNPFSTSTSTNLFAAKPPAFGSQGFGTSSSTSAFGSSVFGSSSTSNPFGSMPSATPSIFGTSSPAFGSSPSSSLFASSSSSALCVPHSPFGSTPAQGTTPSFGAGLNFSNTQSSPLFQSTTPSLGLTGSSFGQNAAAPFQSSIFCTPSAGLGGSFFSSTPQLSTSAPFGFGQTTPSLSSPFQANQATQMSNPFSFSNFGQTIWSTTHSPAVAQSMTITILLGPFQRCLRYQLVVLEHHCQFNMESQACLCPFLVMVMRDPVPQKQMLSLFLGRILEL